MYEPQVLGLSSSALWNLTQALVTPALGFLFLYLMRLPLSALFFLPNNVRYVPPAWVLVLIVSTNIFLNILHERQLAADIEPELYIARDLEITSEQLSKVAIVVHSYDGFSNFRIFLNGYHVFSSDRECVTSFQCKPRDDAEARQEAYVFRTLHRTGGSLYDLSRKNSLDDDIVLSHYLVAGQNYLDVVSENAGTGGCTLSIQLILSTERADQHRYMLRIVPDKGAEPARRARLRAEETLYAGGPIGHGSVLARYNTSRIERRNVVCERVRIALNLDEAQAQRLSRYDEFASYFKAMHKAYICQTIGKPIPSCWPLP
jgi:hypothetical protein